MTKRLSEEAYRLLEPGVRFRAFLTAAAREDSAKVGRLHSTCPRKSYSHCDLEYFDRCKASRTVAWAWALTWQSCHSAWLAAATIVTSEPEHPERPSMLSHTATLAGVYLGLSWFCDAQRLDENELIIAWIPWLASDIEYVLDEYCAVLLSQDPNKLPESLASQLLTEAEAVSELLGRLWHEELA